MEETSAFIAFSVFIAYHPMFVRLCIINPRAASFRDAGNASVICAIAIQAWVLISRLAQEAEGAGGRLN
jgi:hypothetical protein